MPPSPASETVVYLSRWKVPLWIAWFSLLSVGLAALMRHQSPPPFLFTLAGLKSLGVFAFGWVMAAAFAGYAGYYAVQLWRHQPVFRVGVLGIQLGTNRLDPWRDIWDEKVVVTDGKQRKVYLSYSAASTSRRLDVSECGISAARLRELLVYYRQLALHHSSPAA
ncbi:hypothetical protein [Hymenobacter ruricola]|uniref:PH domain-containing protein n=1 Tax=Hymenobacter ruricola TaxID=2791023 RepID=A0ABS0I2U4_9BACT|nr:hypothetical protein [Hymenobacter ruricola]MBF9221277.1 hypothetical protein [Hymenobacter ruricola]